jgi:hypothetical protein
MDNDVSMADGRWRGVSPVLWGSGIALVAYHRAYTCACSFKLENKSLEK